MRILPLPAPCIYRQIPNVEAERRALAGALEALKEQWRQAEEIAGIADALLEPPLSR